MAWVEDFEEYAAGTVPPGWTVLVASNGNQYITDTLAYEGEKSFYIKCTSTTGSTGVQYDGTFGQNTFLIFAYTQGNFSILLNNTSGGTFHNHIAGIACQSNELKVYAGDGTLKDTGISATPYQNRWTKFFILLDWKNDTFTVFADKMQIGGTWDLISSDEFNQFVIAAGDLGEIYFDAIFIFNSYDFERDMVMPVNTVGRLGRMADERDIKSFKRTLGNTSLETKYEKGTVASQDFTAVSDIRAFGVFLTAKYERTVRVGIYTIAGALVKEREFKIVGNDRDEFLFDFGETVNLITGNDYYFEIESDGDIEFGKDMNGNLLFSIYSEAGVFLLGDAGGDLTSIVTSLSNMINNARWREHAQLYIDGSGTVTSDATDATAVTWDNTLQSIALDDIYSYVSITAINNDVYIVLDGTNELGRGIVLREGETYESEEYFDGISVRGFANSEVSATIWKRGLLEA